MNLKEHGGVVFLIGLGALIVLVYLMRQGRTVPVAPNGAIQGGPADNASANYPNANVDQLGGISIGGSPINLTYNSGPPPAPIQIGAPSDAHPANCGCGSDSGCGAAMVASSPLMVKTLPETYVKAAAENFKSFAAKFGTAAIGYGGGVLN